MDRALFWMGLRSIWLSEIREFLVTDTPCLRGAYTLIPACNLLCEHVGFCSGPNLANT